MNRRGFVAKVLAGIGLGGFWTVANADEAQGVEGAAVPGAGPFFDIRVSRGWIGAVRYPWETFGNLLQQFLLDSETGPRDFPPDWRNAINGYGGFDFCLLVPPAMWKRLEADAPRNVPGGGCGWLGRPEELAWRGIHIISRDVAPGNDLIATFRLCKKRSAGIQEAPL